MTYCLGMLLNEGLVLMSDTRTNAGVDNFSTYRKLHTLAETAERQIYACTSGSLSISQAALSMLAEGLSSASMGGGADHAPRRTPATVPTMFQVASLVGEVVAAVRHDFREALSAEGVSSTVSFLIGGRIGDGPLKLYHVYTAGNFIECGCETPYLQIGETKYGKPILDRAMAYDTPLGHAVKVGFLSFDSAFRSNLGVARPLDVLVLPADPSRPIIRRRVEEDDDYFDELSARWSTMLRDARHAIPNPPWIDEPGSRNEEV